MDETVVSLSPFLFPNGDESISWPCEGGRLTRGLFIEVAEEEEGRTATPKGGVYLRGILTWRGSGASV